jgi:hypothetical protein
MKSWKNFAFVVVLTALIISCGSYRPAPEDTIKVLAVTSKGDTIQLDVNSLRPRVYQNIYHTYPYYHNYWRPSPFYHTGNYYYQGSSAPTYRPSNSNSNNSNQSNSSSGSGPNTSSPILSTPPSKPSSNTNQTKGGKNG